MTMSIEHQIGELKGQFDGLQRRIDGIEQRIDTKLQQIEQKQDKIVADVHLISVAIGGARSSWKTLSIAGSVIAALLSSAAWLISTFHPFGIGL